MISYNDYWAVKPMDFERDRNKLYFDTFNYMVDCAMSMITVNNLPDTIPERNLKLLMFKNGFLAGFKHNNNFYVSECSFGADLDPYYEPQSLIVTNPYLVQKTFTIGEDCVLLNNDSRRSGLFRLFQKYATLLTDSDISLRLIDITSRIPYMISGADDNTKQSAELFIDNLIRGRLSIVADNRFIESLQVTPMQSGTNRYTQAIEYNTFLTASWLNKIGIQYNGNMKRESLNEAEVNINNDSLYPFVHDIKKSWTDSFDRFNKLFGTNIEISFNSSWKANDSEFKAELKINENLQTESASTRASQETEKEVTENETD